jgi:hypothetical protein
MTQARLGYQTFLKRGDGNPNGTGEQFNTVIEIISIKGPGAKVDMKDASNMSSPSQTKEIIPGLEDPGQVQLDVNWVPGDAQHKLLLLDKSNKSLRNFQIAVSTGNTWSFSGYVSGFEPNYPVDDKITATITIDITGPATLV